MYHDDKFLMTLPIDVFDKNNVCLHQASRPTALPPNTRDTLYHGLPNNIKAALPSQLQTVADMKEVHPHSTRYPLPFIF